MPHTYKLTIYCNKFPTLKNSKQILFNTRTRRPFISASSDWVEWRKEAEIQVNKWKQTCQYKLPFKRCSISAICFFPDRRTRDLDGIQAGLFDLLKTQVKVDKKTGIRYKSGCQVITDDSWLLLRPISIDAGISKPTPRIEVFITPIEDESIRSK